MIEEQNTQLRTMLNRQNDLKSRVQSLQADTAVVRYQRINTNSSTPSRKKDVAETVEDKHEEPVWK